MISESLFQFTFPQGLDYLLVAVGFLALPSSAGESLARILPSDWELLQHCLQRTGMQNFPNFALSKRSAVPGLTSPGTCSLTPCAILGQDFFSAFLVPHSPDLGPVSWIPFRNALYNWVSHFLFWLTLGPPGIPRLPFPSQPTGRSRCSGQVWSGSILEYIPNIHKLNFLHNGFETNYLALMAKINKSFVQIT